MTETETYYTYVHAEDGADALLGVVTTALTLDQARECFYRRLDDYKNYLKLTGKRYKKRSYALVKVTIEKTYGDKYLLSKTINQETLYIFENV